MQRLNGCRLLPCVAVLLHTPVLLALLRCVYCVINFIQNKY